MTRKRRRLYIVVAALVVFGSATALVLTALDDSLDLFQSPSQIMAAPPPPERGIRLGGLVEEGTVLRSTDGLGVTFRITDGAQSVPVRYRGISDRRTGPLRAGSRPGGCAAAGQPADDRRGTRRRRLDGTCAAGGLCAAGPGGLFAFAALTHAYVTSDFSVTNVAANSHSAKPMLYKVTGVWGNHEGSMLLWILILALFGARWRPSAATCRRALRARVLGVQGLIGIGFLAFTSSPPTRSCAPRPGAARRRGLNPLLQDPGLAFHPPILYLGYVGFSMAFSFAVAALIEGRVDAAWARWVRPWTLPPGRLTAGIALGSLVGLLRAGLGRLVVLGPGGERLLHALAGGHRAAALGDRGGEARRAEGWTVLLAILTFSLS
jgi:hypothetical protein